MSLTLIQALETSQALQERLAVTSSTEKRAALEQTATMVNFATFDMFKHAWTGNVGPALSAAARSPLGKGLQWGAGLGIPAVGAAHMMARGARGEGEKLVDHTRNQALLTALGVGGIQSVGNAVSNLTAPRPPAPAPAPTPEPTPTAPPTQQTQSYEEAMSQPGLGVRELAALRGYPGLGRLEGRQPRLSLNEIEGLGGLSMEDLRGLDGFDGYKFRPDPDDATISQIVGDKLSSDQRMQKLAAVVLLDDVLEQQVAKLAGTEQADALECLHLNRNHGTRLLRELY